MKDDLPHSKTCLTLKPAHMSFQKRGRLALGLHMARPNVSRHFISEEVEIFGPTNGENTHFRKIEGQYRTGP